MLTHRSGRLLPSRQYDFELAASLDRLRSGAGTVCSGHASGEEWAVRLGRRLRTFARSAAPLAVAVVVAASPACGRDRSEIGQGVSATTSSAPATKSTSTTLEQQPST